MTVGIGAGQMSRVNSSRIAAWKAADAAKVAGEGTSWAQGSVVASDAFFHLQMAFWPQRRPAPRRLFNREDLLGTMKLSLPRMMPVFLWFLQACVIFGIKFYCF